MHRSTTISALRTACDIAAAAALITAAYAATYALVWALVALGWYSA